MKLSHIAIHLGTTLDEALTEAITEEAEALADALREEFSGIPGGPHTHPWQQTGVLRDSISVSVGNGGAVIGSDDPVALYQEHGTDTVPPRPTFAPLAAVAAPGIAQRIGHAAMTALREDDPAAP